LRTVTRSVSPDKEAGFHLLESPLYTDQQVTEIGNQFEISATVVHTSGFLLMISPLCVSRPVAVYPMQSLCKYVTFRQPAIIPIPPISEAQHSGADRVVALSDIQE
jgi:hypothetical protein